MSTDLNERFRALYERYYSDVVAWLRRRGVEKEQARELAQDTFLRVYRYLEGRRGSSPWPWILTIAKHVFANWLRARATEKRGGLKRLDVKKIPELEPDVDAPWIRKEESPDGKTIRKAEIERLNEVVGALPERARQVLLLRFRDGLKNPEVARMLDISVDTVKTHLHKARARIRSAFPDNPFEERHDEQ